MQARRTLKIGHAAVLFGLGVAGCGQITGLSDDHVFDLVDGGSADGATDAKVPEGGSMTDASTDAFRPDAPGSCSAAAVVSAEQRMASFSGTTICKTCLARGCCDDVETCSKTSDCRNILACKLDCTTKQAGGERMQCFSRCDNSGVPASYTSGVGACAPQACKQECGFQ